MLYSDADNIGAGLLSAGLNRQASSKNALVVQSVSLENRDDEVDSG